MRLRCGIVAETFSSLLVILSRKPLPKITFTTKLWAGMPGASWTFATLPRTASAKLGSRGRVPIAGTIGGFPFRSSAFPDGKGSHTIQINKAMRDGAGADIGDTAKFVIEVDTKPVPVKVPEDVNKAIAKSKPATARWKGMTPKAKNFAIAWVTEAKATETRKRRISRLMAALEAGKRDPRD